MCGSLTHTPHILHNLLLCALGGMLLSAPISCIETFCSLTAVPIFDVLVMTCRITEVIFSIRSMVETVAFLIV